MTRRKSERNSQTTAAYLHTLGVIVLLIAVDVVIRDLLLADPALLHCLLVALAAARLVVPDEEDLTEFDTAVFTPEGSQMWTELRTNKSQVKSHLKQDLWYRFPAAKTPSSVRGLKHDAHFSIRNVYAECQKLFSYLLFHSQLSVVCFQFSPGRPC